MASDAAVATLAGGAVAPEVAASGLLPVSPIGGFRISFGSSKASGTSDIRDEARLITEAARLRDVLPSFVADDTTDDCLDEVFREGCSCRNGARSRCGALSAATELPPVRLA